MGGDILLSVLDLLRHKVVICYAAEISLPTAKLPGYNTMNRAAAVKTTSATYILQIGRLSFVVRKVLVEILALH